MTYPLNSQYPTASAGNRSGSGKIEKLMVLPGPSRCKGPNAAAPSQSIQGRGDGSRAGSVDSTGRKGEWSRTCGECIDPWVKRVNQFRKSLNPCFLAFAFNLLKAMITNPPFYSVESLPKIQGLVLVY